jgi:hypothetical protein
VTNAPSQALGLDLDANPSETAVESDKPQSAAALAHSAKNIALWTSYLPPACVKLMIKMGWDHST